MLFSFGSSVGPRRRSGLGWFCVVGVVGLAVVAGGCADGSSPFQGPDAGVADLYSPTTTPDLLLPDAPEPDTPKMDDVDPPEVPPQNAILVSPIGTDDADCGLKPETPCQTIGFAIVRAGGYVPKRPVAASGGNYHELVELDEGVDLLGGYNAEFIRNAEGNTRTVIKAPVVDGKAIGLRVGEILTATKIERVIIEAPDAEGAGESSYGLYIGNAPDLTVIDSTIIAGNGVDGETGSGSDVPAAAGKPGKPGRAGGQYIDELEPIGCPNPQSGAIGDRGEGGAAVTLSGGGTCGSAGGKGGMAGVDSCDATDGYSVANAALNSAVAECTAETAGRGGQGGAGGSQDSDCDPRRLGASGVEGCDGLDGSDGTDGVGGDGFEVVDGFYRGSAGTSGTDGLNDAMGGGGGGGGGGGDCDLPRCLLRCVSDWGGGGGGGGSAGCPGEGGGAGSAGGGSFGIFLLDSDASLKVQGSTIITNAGGQGGDGGAGQPGGPGGDGGDGGDAFQEAGAGGKGGKGGDGGAGGHGGGGAGGPSIAVFVVAGEPPTMTNTQVVLGQAGKGGASDVAPGADGQRAEVGPAPVTQ